MRALRLARWLLPSGMRRVLVPLVVASLGVGFLGAALPMVADSASSTSERADGLGSAILRVVEIGSYGYESDPAPLDREALERIRAMADVESAHGKSSVSLTVGAGDALVWPDLVSRIPAVQPPLVSGREPSAAGEILLSHGDATELGIVAGDEVETEYIRLLPDESGVGVDGTATVVGTFDDTITGIDGEHVAYATDDMVWELLAQARSRSLEWMEANFVYPTAYVVLDDATSLPAFVDTMRAQGYSLASLASLLTGVSAAQSFLTGLQPILAIMLAVLLLVIGWSTASAAVASRRAEVGVLRALGWQRREVVWTFVAQFAAQGVAVGLTGAALTFAVAVGLGMVPDAALFGVPLTIAVDGTLAMRLAGMTGATALVFVVAAVVPVLRASRIDPDEVLRDLDR